MAETVDCSMARSPKVEVVLLDWESTLYRF